MAKSVKQLYRLNKLIALTILCIIIFIKKVCRKVTNLNINHQKRL